MKPKDASSCADCDEPLTSEFPVGYHAEPYDYDVSQGLCLGCWLGVGPKDLAASDAESSAREHA